MNGDLEELIRIRILGVSLEQGDYDKRTPMHQAACGGHIEVIEYLI